MRHISIILALTTLLLLSTTTNAQTVTFTYEYQCSSVSKDSCTFSKMNIAGRLGGIGSDIVPIGTVKSDVPGYTNPVPIDQGLLTYTTTPATWVFIDGTAGQATYDLSGGATSITGSVFGLGEGSTLLTATFEEGGRGNWVTQDETEQANINISYVNPAILANLGLNGLPNYGTGTVYDEFDWFNQPWFHYSVSITFTPGPQCSSDYAKYSSDTTLSNRTPDNLHVLHNFTGAQDGGVPFGQLAVDQAGNLYGSTELGGSGNGTVFQFKKTSSGGLFKPLYKFTGPNDGSQPFSGITIGPSGVLYGATSWLGSGGLGTVFAVKPSPTAPRSALQPWPETVIQSFSGSNGDYPYGSLVFDGKGNLYGTTLWNVFELSPAGGGWTESVLANVDFALTGVAFDQSGNLYGTTWGGGSGNCNNFKNGCGTVFQLKPSAQGWTQNTLYSFSNSGDGAFPAGGLVPDSVGNVYGTTTGWAGQPGTVFQLSPSGDSWSFSVLYAIGGAPRGNLTMDSIGNIYGTTSRGGTYGRGSVFKLTPSGGGWTETDLYSFSGGDGAAPMGGVTLASDGTLFGTTAYGGAYGCGVLYNLAP